MSTQEKDVIKTVKVQTAKRQKPPVTSRAYRGTSTVDPNATGFNLYDLALIKQDIICLLYTSPSPRDRTRSRMPSSA